MKVKVIDQIQMQNEIFKGITRQMYKVLTQLQNCSSPEKFLLTDWRATVPPIVKTVISIAQKKLRTVKT